MTEPYIDPNSGAASQPGGASIAAPNPIDTVVKESSKEVDQTEAVDGEKVDEQAAEHLEQQAKEAAEAKEAEGQELAVPTGTPEAGTDVGTDVTGDATPAAEGDAPEAYDPGSKSVPQVLAYIETNPDEHEAVLAAERAGKARKGILEP